MHFTASESTVYRLFLGSPLFYMISLLFQSIPSPLRKRSLDVRVRVRDGGHVTAQKALAKEATCSLFQASGCFPGSATSRMRSQALLVLVLRLARPLPLGLKTSVLWGCRSCGYRGKTPRFTSLALIQ